MPSDNRRIQGPEDSRPYLLYSNKKIGKPYEEYIKDFVSEAGQRRDGRKSKDLRKLYTKMGIITQAKGSAYVEHDKTKVVCSVFDPREIPHKNEFCDSGELYCEFKYAPFSCKKKRGLQQDSEEKEFSLILKRALEPAVCRHEFPNFQVDIYVLVIENDGSALAAGITCAALALADASVPMYDLVVAATMGIHGDLEFMDPNEEEESLCNTPPPADSNQNHGTITVAYMPMHQQVSELAQCGIIDVQYLTSSIQKLCQSCEILYPVSKQCIVKTVTKALKNKNVSSE